MALFVHLTSRAETTRVRRFGVRTSTGQGKVRGVFCFPVLPSYAVTHQWSRALGPHHEPHGLVAVDVCLPDEEPVTVGHFDDPNARRVSAIEAVRVISGLTDPDGWEVVVPRPVLKEEVRRIREVRGTSDHPIFTEPLTRLLSVPPTDTFPLLRPEPLPRSADAFADLGRLLPEQALGDPLPQPWTHGPSGL